MPTGYTNTIKDDITFKQFALGCARDFGALVSMREEPKGAEIPDRFEPSDYHSKNLIRLLQEKTALLSLGASDIEIACDVSWEKKEKGRLNRLNELSELRSKYEEMLNHVEAWEPPTADHNEMKDFMRNQILESIRFDCIEDSYASPAPRTTPSAYLDKQLARINSEEEYHKKEDIKEHERVNARNEWLSELRDSL